MRAGIVGAGLLGRLLAWRLVEQGWQVTVFDEHGECGRGSATHAAGGMIASIVEQETAEFLIYQIAQNSIVLWQEWLAQLNATIFFQKTGSLLLASTEDLWQLHHLATRIKQRVGLSKVLALNVKQIQQLEPELTFRQGYFLPNEAQIDARALLTSLAQWFIKNKVAWHCHTKVAEISPGLIVVDHKKFVFDWVFDCRGIGAKLTFTDLRAVRGELIYLKAPEVKLSHMIRFLHPRYRLYVIPRPQQVYLIGATELEGFDASPISVRSCLELLSAAYCIHKGFAEARIIETVTAMRPAFSNNLPRIFYQSGLVAINGLYRHGFLLAPTIVDDVISLITHGLSKVRYSKLIEEVTDDYHSI